MDILLLRYLEAPDKLEANEKVSVERWINADPRNEERLKELSRLWKRSGEARRFSQLDMESDWQEVWAQMQETSTVTREMPRGNAVSTFFKIAAAVALLVSVSWFVWQANRGSDTPADVLSYTAGDTTVALTLPDGSQVFLNKGAKISHSPDFNGEDRVVSLEGEGYFEVAHDPALPFFIHVGQTSVKVIGTGFNVLEQGETIKITVNSGKVAFSHDQDTVLLTQNEVGWYNSKSIREYINDDPNFLSWKTGILTFNETPFPQVVDDLVRFYDVDMKITSNHLSDLTYTSVLNNQPLEEVLEELQIVLDINYSYQNNRVTFQ